MSAPSASSKQPPRIILAAPNEPTTSYDYHSHRRLFIGPMPEKVLAQTDSPTGKKKRKDGKTAGWLHLVDGDDEMDGVSTGSTLFRVIDDHAFHFFLRQGGKVEEWGEDVKDSTREEMLRRWRESEWGGILRRRRKEGSNTARRWVGGSFEVGSVLGVNIIGNTTPRDSQIGPATASEQNVRPSLQSKPSGAPSSDVQELFSAAGVLGPSPPRERSKDSRAGRSSSSSPDGTNHGSTEFSHSSSTALLMPGTAPDLRNTSENNTGDSRRPILRGRASSSARAHGHGDTAQDGSFLGASLRKRRSNLFTQDKGKRKSVHYADSNPPPRPPSESGDEDPAPPTEVLARMGSDVDETSAGATLEAVSPQDELRWGDVVLRDRMLVRVSYTKSESLPPGFDEKQNRVTGNLRYEDWAEFLVVWRKDRIEIYEDYSLPGKEFFTGHKHLAFLIPLNSLNTRLSLYSFADLTFCLMSPPTPVRSSGSKARAIFHHGKEGTNVFVFKTKSRTRALDWTWQLWRHLGGEIPSTIEVRCPSIEARVKIDVPVIDIINMERAYTMFSRRNIIELVQKSLGSSHHSGDAASRDWKYVIEREMAAGKTLELAWRMEAKLDWVWQEDDIEGNPRPWAILCGLVLKQSRKSSHLELRLGEHFPATIHAPNGTKLHEPPAIEGYLDRIKPNTQSKQQVYLSSHDGSLFSISPWDANPPTPPNVHLSRDVSKHGDMAKVAQELYKGEVKRGATQVTVAYGVLDLRKIACVRRASTLVPQYRTDDVQEDPHETVQEVDRSDSDDEDEGGVDGMAKASDKARLRLQRSFEIVLSSGLVIRFEAYSCRTSLEWIERLRALILYWKHRHHVDARDEMDLAYSTNHRLRLTPHITKCARADGHDVAPEPPTDSESTLPALGALYHWCVLNDCRSVIRGGRVFTKKGLRGQYKLVQLFLVSGHLVQYHVSPKSTLHRRRAKEISLLDAYVCSGYLAALGLRGGEYDPDSPSVPRRYQDGLEADDPEEDMLFIIWYRKNKNELPSGSSTNFVDGSRTVKEGPKAVPPLSSKHKIAVFRTRSKVERDAWCWALGCEIDKLARRNKDREAKLRESGSLVSPSR
ncbi:hypothetical protein BV22DRAFT_1197834 [Leucogyrophana mollusca]|uniref:Uncharacterized protein n=1 Tax=Leucogyrophana mollusca TaxID=85980 RepID=A0ACB8B852_9AGAM|nr:hypothetical protein BV22DRAFT_1197834 [Leucogyrophana mollusca]